MNHRETCFDLEKLKMNSSRILVSGFPDGTSKTALMIYFQSVRESGGGDVESIEIDRRTARITFTEAQGRLFELHLAAF